MENKYTTEELIDRYINDELLSDERAAFERQMKDSPELAGKVELTRHIVNAIECKCEREALAEMSDIDSKEKFQHILRQSEQKHRPAVRRMALRRWILAPVSVAAVIVLVVVGFLPRYSTAELFTMSYQTPLYESLVSRGGIELEPPLLELLDYAAERYEAGDMTAAMKAYDKAAVYSPELPDNARFYRAVAMNETGHIKQAAEEFTLIINDKESEFAEDALWQQALICLRVGERKKAAKLLTEIKAEGGFYSVEAAGLLSRLHKKLFF